MARVFVIVLILSSLSHVIYGDPKYSATAIPEELKKGMYAVIRESDSKFYIDSKKRSTNHVRLVITILNSNAKSYASLTIGYDKLSKVESFKANVYDAQGNLIKRLKQNEIVDQSSVSDFSLYEDNRIKHADLAQNTYPYTVEFEYVVTYRYLYFIPEFQLYNDR